MRFAQRAFGIWLLAAASMLAAATGEVRGYLTTGAWYPRDPGQLNRLLDVCFQGARTVFPPAAVRGLVVPHAGLVYSGRVAARAFIHLQGRKNVRRIILLGVSHSGGFSGACVSSFSANSTPLGKIPVDRAVVKRLARQPGFQVNNRIMQREHSLENQLPFLQRVLAGVDFKLVPLLFGRVTPEEAAAIARGLKPFLDEETLVVASSDLTHYGRRFGYHPFKENLAEQLHDLDRGLLERVIALDHAGYRDYLQRTGMTMCGSVPVAVWMHLFDARRYDLKVAAYTTSGDNNGDYSLSVGYGAVVCALKQKATEELSPAEQTGLLAIARRTLEASLAGRDEDSILAGVDLSPALQLRAGVFVTLRRKHRLRGCIGSIVGTRPLYRGVMANARNAAFNDPRFPAVQAAELGEISIEISVMTPLQRITDYRSIQLGRDGVIISLRNASAVYLPQVATETGWDLDTFLSNLCRKAGLSSRAYRSPDMEFRVFQAQVFAEEGD